MVKKVVIIGAGPSGVLLAHYLLRRNDQYQVEIYDNRSDPRQVSFSKARTFAVSLNERGMNALCQIPGVEEAVRAISVEMSGTIFHQKNGKTRITPRKKPLITLDRTNLAIVLLETLTQNYNNSRLNIYFNCQCTQVDLKTKTLVIQNLAETSQAEPETNFTVSYDLLIGADGANSKVRTALLSTDLFEFQQKYVPNDYKSIFISDTQETHLEFGKIHTWRIDDGTIALLLHQRDKTLSGAVLFPRRKNQITGLSTPEEVRQFFQNNFPEISQLLPPSEIEAFLKRPISRVLTIRCSHYHYGDSVLLIGDAAHSVSPSIGQGCNSALEDALIINRLLDEYSDDIAQVLKQFTQRRKVDAHALSDLSDYAFPASTKLFLEFIFREQKARILHKLFPNQFPASLSDSIFETTMSYSEILKIHQDWISKVKKANEKLLPF